MTDSNVVSLSPSPKAEPGREQWDFIQASICPAWEWVDFETYRLRYEQALERYNQHPGVCVEWAITWVILDQLGKLRFGRQWDAYRRGDVHRPADLED